MSLQGCVAYLASCRIHTNPTWLHWDLNSRPLDWQTWTLPLDQSDLTYREDRFFKFKLPTYKQLNAQKIHRFLGKKFYLPKHNKHYLQLSLCRNCAFSHFSMHIFMYSCMTIQKPSWILLLFVMLLYRGIDYTEA